MQIKEVKNITVSSETNRKRRAAYKKIRHGFIVSCGSGFVTAGGDLKPRLSIHHNIPSSLQAGNNRFDNLSIVEKRLHNLIHEKVLSPQINSRAKMVEVPLFARVIDDAERCEFFDYLRERRIR